MTALSRTAALQNAFYTAENGNLCLVSDHPLNSYVASMVHSASDAGLGENFAYEAVREVLETANDWDLQNPGKIESEAFEIADSLVEVYTANLVHWLAEAPIAHLAICQEVFEEFGHPHCAEDVLRQGQHLAYLKAVAAVAENWPPDCEECDGAGEVWDDSTDEIVTCTMCQGSGYETDNPEEAE